MFSLQPPRHIPTLPFATGPVSLRFRRLDRNALEADMMRGLPARQESDEISGAKQRSLTDLDAP